MNSTKNTSASNGESPVIMQVTVGDKAIAENIHLILNQFTANQGGFSFRRLDEEFLTSQESAKPGAFYDGQVANWANIARGNDVSRDIHSGILEFIKSPHGGNQRMALIRGLAGEGKTTLLMRLAWDLAKQGYPVLWPDILKNNPLPDSQETLSLPWILCFDQVDTIEQLPELLRAVSANGIFYMVLATARQHEWKLANKESCILPSLGSLKYFDIGRLSTKEVASLLDKLDGANKLGKLSELSRPQQIDHFINRLKADGQLLPALITARAGSENFKNHVKQVLDKIEARKNGEFLLKAYTILSAIHRFGYSLPRKIFSDALGIHEFDIAPRVLTPLSGELLEVSEHEEGLATHGLSTRHPLIAEVAFEIICERHDSRHIYIDLINVLKEIVRPDAFHRNGRGLLTAISRSLRGEGQEFLDSILSNIAAETENDSVFWEIWGIFARTVESNDYARDFFRRAAELDPTRASIWQAWGVMESRLKHFEEAERLFQRGEATYPNHAPTLQAWGWMKAQQGDMKNARRLFDRAVKANPKDGACWFAWAVQEGRNGELDNAIDLYIKGLQVEPDDRIAWESLSTLMRRHPDKNKQHGFFEQITQSTSAPAPVWLAWALVEKQSNPDHARELFQKSIKINPHIVAYHEWALMEKQHGNYSKARELFETGSLADLSDAPILQAWGLMEEELGNIEEARQLFKRATQVDPQTAYAWNAWAILEKRQGDFEKAREYFHRGTLADPASGPTWGAWAEFEKGQGDVSKAIELFEEGIKRDPRNAPTYSSYAQMMKERKDIQKARELFKLSTEVDPKNAQAWQMWAVMEQKRGDIHTARGLFEDGIKADPTHGALWQAYAIMEKEQGDILKARELFEKGIAADPTHAPLWQAYAVMEGGEARKYMRLGDITKAKEYTLKARRLFEAGAKADPTNPHVWHAWAEMEKRERNIDKAKELYQKSTGSSPTNMLLWNSWALLELNDNPRYAASLIERALEYIKKPRDRAGVFTTYARILSKLGLEPEAEEAFRAALQLDKLNYHAHYYYAWLILEKQGRAPEAREHYHYALNLDPKPYFVSLIEQALNRLAYA